MIVNAKDKQLGAMGNSLPDVSEAIRLFFQPLSVGLIVKELVSGIARERINYVSTRGVVQPFSTEKLSMKAEGERSWKWFTIHCDVDLVLETDDIIVIDGLNYRVMDKSNFSAYGYLQYDVQQDYKKVAF